MQQRPKFEMFQKSIFPITPVKDAPRLRAQCTFKRGREQAPLNRRKG